MDAFDSLFDMYGVAAVFAVMLTKAVGVPIPIPGDVVLLAMGARAAAGKVLLTEVFIALLVAMVLGSTLQFLLARGVGRQAVYRFGGFLGLTEARLDAAAGAVKKGGVLGLGLAIFTPGVRTATIPACGLAGLSLRVFVPALVLGSALGLVLHLGLGFFGAPLILGLFQSTPVGWVLVAALLLAGLGAWIVLVRRRRGGSVREALLAWDDATCPVCLVVGGAALRS